MLYVLNKYEDIERFWDLSLDTLLGQILKFNFS